MQKYIKIILLISLLLLSSCFNKDNNISKENNTAVIEKKVNEVNNVNTELNNSNSNNETNNEINNNELNDTKKNISENEDSLKYYTDTVLNEIENLSAEEYNKNIQIWKYSDELLFEYYYKYYNDNKSNYNDLMKDEKNIYKAYNDIITLNSGNWKEKIIYKYDVKKDEQWKEISFINKLINVEGLFNVFEVVDWNSIYKYEWYNNKIHSVNKIQIKFNDLIYKSYKEKITVTWKDWIEKNLYEKPIEYDQFWQEQIYISSLHDISPSWNILTFYVKRWDAWDSLYWIQTQSKELLWENEYKVWDMIWSPDNKQVAFIRWEFESFKIDISEFWNVRKIKNYLNTTGFTIYWWDYKNRNVYWKSNDILAVDVIETDDESINERRKEEWIKPWVIEFKTR